MLRPLHPNQGLALDLLGTYRPPTDPQVFGAMTYGHYILYLWHDKFYNQHVLGYEKFLHILTERLEVIKEILSHESFPGKIIFLPLPSLPYLMAAPLIMSHFMLWHILFCKYIDRMLHLFWLSVCHLECHDYFLPLYPGAP